MQVIDKVIAVFITPCLVENEPYAVRSRKFIVISFAIIASTAFLLGMPVSILGALDDPSFYGVYYIGATLFTVTFSGCVIPYTYMRRTKELPEWVPSMQMWCTVPTTLGFTLFAHQGSVPIMCTVVTFTGIVMRISAWPLMLMYGVSINVLHALINDFAPEIPVLHDTFYVTQGLSVRIIYLVGVNILPPILLGFGLFAIMKEFAERSDQADAAIAMNLAVAEKLRRYDTEGVAVILAQNSGKVDENLLTAFAGIQRNLEEFRPHIPDYVIAATTSQSDEGDDEGVISSMNSSTTNLGHVSLVASNHSRNNNIYDIGALSEDAPSEGVPSEFSVRSFTSPTHQGEGSPIMGDLPSPHAHALRQLGGSSNRMTTTFPQHMSPNSDGDEGSLHLSSFNSKPHHSHSRGNSRADTTNVTIRSPVHGPRRNDSGGRIKGRGGPLTRSPVDSPLRSSHVVSSHTDATLVVTTAKVYEDSSKHQTNRQHFYGRATTVFIRFVAACTGGDSNGAVQKGSSVAAMFVLNKCVESAAVHAKTHHGALQYMQGCGLMVSFNAASRVAAHESKACAFVLSVVTNIQEFTSGVAVHASVVTSNVLSFFAGNSGQLLLTVLGSFMQQHTAMHHYLSQTVGRDASCVLISESVMPAIEMMYDTRKLGGIVFQPMADALGSFNARRNSSIDANNQPPSKDAAPPKISSNILVISQLIAARKVQDDEWMYHMKTKPEDDPNSTVNKVVEMALGGDYSMFIHQFVNTEITNGDKVFEKCVRKRLVDCDQNIAEFCVRYCPVMMW